MNRKHLHIAVTAGLMAALSLGTAPAFAEETAPSAVEETTDEGTGFTIGIQHDEAMNSLMNLQTPVGVLPHLPESVPVEVNGVMYPSGVDWDDVTSNQFADPGTTVTVRGELTGGEALPDHAQEIIDTYGSGLYVKAEVAVVENASGYLPTYNEVQYVTVELGTSFDPNSDASGCTTAVVHYMDAEGVDYEAGLPVSWDTSWLDLGRAGAQLVTGAVEMGDNAGFAGTDPACLYVNVIDPNPSTEPEICYAASLNGTKYETVQAAVDAAQDGDTILILNEQPGVIYPDTELKREDVLIKDKSLVIEGQDVMSPFEGSFTLENAEGTIIRDMIFRTWSHNWEEAEAAERVIDINDSSNVKIDDCLVELDPYLEYQYREDLDESVLIDNKNNVDRTGIAIRGNSDNVAITDCSINISSARTSDNLPHVWTGIKVIGSQEAVDNLTIESVGTFVLDSQGGHSGFGDEDDGSAAPDDAVTVRLIDIDGACSDGTYGVNGVTLNEISLDNQTGRFNRISKINGIKIVNANNVLITGRASDDFLDFCYVDGNTAIVLGDEEGSGSNGSIMLGDIGFNSYIGAQRYANGGDVEFGDPVPSISENVVTPYIGFDNAPEKPEPEPEPEPEPDPEPTPDPDPTPVPTPDPDEDEDVAVPETEGGSVEVEPVPAGETATVVCEPEPGQEVRDVVVTDSEGNRVETSVDEDGNVTFEMPEGGVTVEVVFGCDGGELCGTHQFADIDQEQWYHDSVDWAIGAGVFHGYDDGTFGPDDVLTREQAAAVLYNYLGGEPGAPGSGLSDVSEDWYTDAVNWAVANGIMTGYEGAGAFGVGDALTREQFCSVVAKAVGADLEGVDASVLDGFSDADSVSGWARSAVAWAVEAGVVNGVENPDGTRSLQGARDITRAEMAAMMKNAVDAGVLTTA